MVSKRFYISETALIIATLIFIGCNQNQEYLIENYEVTDNVSQDPHYVSAQEASLIALDYFNESSRCLNQDIFMTPIVFPTGRSQMDTLAYVFNRKEDQGFVIISSDNRGNQILAFNETGNLSFDANENDPVYMNFIVHLKPYLDNIEEFENSDLLEDNVTINQGFAGGMVPLSWSQRDPFDKYVILEHPGCPVGCVAVATGQAMVFGKATLSNYHGSTFDMEEINMALLGEDAEDQLYTYNEAIDSIAKILYYIGKDVGMNYGTSASGALPNSGLNLLKSLGYNLESDTLKTYAPLAMAYDLMYNRLIYMRGSDTSNQGGHAWIVDQCKFSTTGPLVLPTTALIFDIYLHCDWGWGGSNNGYYSGDVFQAGSYSFGNMQYFSVNSPYSS